jgi:hypothetical protein
VIQGNKEIEHLQSLGWFQEHYEIYRNLYDDWNTEVWAHHWTLVKATCALCLLEEPSILAGNQVICLPCLKEYEEVPWHPTGSVTPKADWFVHHAMACQKHQT